jgi:xylulokinase
MEGISYSMRDSLEEIRRNNVRVDQFRVIGGGAKSPLWSQILCDILGEPLWRTQNNDSSLGSAMMAGVACGLFESFADSVAKCVKVSGFIEPIAENVKVYEENFQFYREIQKAMAPIYEKMI